MDRLSVHEGLLEATRARQDAQLREVERKLDQQHALRQLEAEHQRRLDRVGEAMAIFRATMDAAGRPGVKANGGSLRSWRLASRCWQRYNTQATYLTLFVNGRMGYTQTHTVHERSLLERWERTEHRLVEHLELGNIDLSHRFSALNTRCEPLRIGKPQLIDIAVFETIGAFCARYGLTLKKPSPRAGSGRAAVSADPLERPAHEIIDEFMSKLRQAYSRAFRGLQG